MSVKKLDSYLAFIYLKKKKGKNNKANGPPPLYLKNESIRFEKLNMIVEVAKISVSIFRHHSSMENI